MSLLHQPVGGRVIYRYELAPGPHGNEVLTLPAGSEILTVSPISAELWASVPVNPLRGIGIPVRVAQTGREVPEGRYVGTFIVHEGEYHQRFVGHVYIGKGKG